MKKVTEKLLHPEKFWSPGEILTRPSPVPKRPGVYAWYFREIPPRVPVTDCITYKELTLLYMGISPSRPESKANLHKRIRTHLRGNASGSTLRLTLGCLLSDSLNLQLRRVGRTQRMTFSAGETRISSWLDKNCFVTWTEVPEPWVYEELLFDLVSLPLNLNGNANHPFHSELSLLRRNARAQARKLPVLLK